MKTKVMQVGGMSCGHCSARVEEALRGVEGVSSASVDLDAARATVEYDEGKADGNDLVKAVQDAGYSVDEGQSATPAESAPKKKGFFRRG